MSVRFRFDWVDAGPSPVMLARTTMASLSIKAGGSTVTSVLNRGHRIYSDEIIVPLFHVAEWLVTNWWHLWHEVRDTGEQRPGFDARHNLAFAGGGFVLPNLTMTPTAGRMHLQWTRYKPRHARIEFVDEGQESVERKALETEFRNCIDAVLERLHGRTGTDAAASDLGRAWNAVNDLDADELEFSRAAAGCAARRGSPRRTRRGCGPDRDVLGANRPVRSRRRARERLRGLVEQRRRMVGGFSRDPRDERKDDDWPAVREALPRRECAEPWT